MGNPIGSEKVPNSRTSGHLEVRGRITEVAKSLIPNVTIYTIDCGDVKIKFDVQSKLVRLKSGDEVVITISKHLPNYEKGVDFVAWGYVMSLKQGESLFKMVISLWGYIVIVETNKQELLSGFNFMDKVYFKISRPTNTSVST
ncbi:MAG: DNA-directed RNA polymerase subunit G [Sulfolobales archaeon]